MLFRIFIDIEWGRLFNYVLIEVKDVVIKIIVIIFFICMRER